MSLFEKGIFLAVADPQGSDRTTTNYIQTDGITHLRQRFAQTLERREGITVPADALPYVTIGSQEALKLVARAYVDKGDAVITRAPGYPGLLNAFKVAGARIIGIPTTEDGIDLGVLSRAVRESRPKLIAFNPVYSNPDQQIFPPEVLAGIIEIGRDAPGGSGVPGACQGAGEHAGDQPGRGPHQDHFQIPLADEGGLLVAPKDVIKAVDPIKQNSNLCGSGSDQAFAYELLLDGAEWEEKNPGKERTARARYRAIGLEYSPALLDSYSGRLARNRGNYLARSGDSAEIFAWEFSGTPVAARFGVMFAWVELPKGTGSEALAREYLREGGTFVPGPAFDTNGDGSFDNFYRWNFTSMPAQAFKEAIRLQRKAYERLTGK